MKPLHILDNHPTVKLALLRLAWSNPLRVISPIEAALYAVNSRLAGNVSFLNIGSHDGMSGSPLTEFIFKHGWKGVMIEANPEVFKRLENNMADKTIRCLNYAIDSYCGPAIFYLPKKKGFLFNGKDQLGSLHCAVTEKTSSQYLRQIEVQRRDLKTAIGSINRFDVVVIDTEGNDDVCVDQLKHLQNVPCLVIYEDEHLSQCRKEQAETLMKARGYTLTQYNGNVICTIQ